MTVLGAIALLGKRVWVIVHYGRYGRVARGELCHVTFHAEKLGRGEWSAYVASGSRGMDYTGDLIFANKADAEKRLKNLLEIAQQDVQS